MASLEAWLKNMRNTGVLYDHNAKRLMLQPVDAATGGDGAGMPGSGVTERSCQLRHCQTERTGDCRLQHETDRGCVFDSASQKQLSKRSQKPFLRVLTRHWKPACRWQQKHHAVILVRPPWVQGAPDITGKSSRILPGE